MNKQIEDIISIIVISLSITYCYFYMLSGKRSSPLSFKYNQLFVWNSLKKHLIFALTLSALGIIRFNSLTLETYYFTPILFITSTLIFNLIIKLVYNRNILMETPYGLNNHGFSKNAKTLDKFFTLLIFLISLSIPIILKAPKFSEMNNRHLNEIKNTTSNINLEKQ